MAGELKNDLIFAMNDPTVRLYSDEFVTIIADKFPKSKHHYLVLPHEDISDVRDIKEHHIPKLIYMELIGLEFAMAHTNLPAHGFLVGYHAYPSMKRLHLHILSNDFNSPHLKESYQWNLFHTEFFINTHKMISDLQTKGLVILPPNKRCLQQKLQCHKCKYFSNELKYMKMHLSLLHS